MTHVEVSDWFDQNKLRKQKEFGVPHFRITILLEHFGSEEGGEGCMKCQSWPDYERATITVNPAVYRSLDAAELEHDFEHELMHVIHSPFELVRAMGFELLAGTNAEGWNALCAMFNKCCEMTVRNMERMTYGLRNEPAKLWPNDGTLVSPDHLGTGI